MLGYGSCWRVDLKGSIIIKRERERERYKWAHKKRPRSARFKAHVSSQYRCAVLKLAKAKPKPKAMRSSIFNYFYENLLIGVRDLKPAIKACWSV